jgi:hypothetical protein
LDFPREESLSLTHRFAHFSRGTDPRKVKEENDSDDTDDEEVVNGNVGDHNEDDQDANRIEQKQSEDDGHDRR